jgi:hypothetical protein
MRMQQREPQPVDSRVEQVRQQAEAMQRRVQQQLQQVQKLQGQSPSSVPAVVRPSQVLRVIGASQANVQAHQMRAQAILSRVREMRAHHHQREMRAALHQQRVEGAGAGLSVVRHQLAMQHMMARFRHRPPGLARGGHSPRPDVSYNYYSRQLAIYTRLLEKVVQYRIKLEVKSSPTKVNVAGLGNVTVPSGSAGTSLPAGSSGKSSTDPAMSKLGGPRQAKSDDKSDDKPDNKLAMRKLGTVVYRDGLLPPLRTFMRNEVLALNVDKNKLRRFKFGVSIVEETNLDGLGYRITRLKVDDQLNAVMAITELEKEVPSDGYNLNMLYEPYRTTGATSPSGAGTSAPPPPSTPTNREPPPAPNKQASLGGVLAVSPNRGGVCSHERCLASALIKWRPQLGACARNVRIGVIDTGYDRSHPAFIGARINEPRPEHRALPAGSAEASNVHGTGVLALLAGNPASSTPGLVPQADFYVQNAFFADGRGNAMSSTMVMLKALNWMKMNKVDVLNLSFAGPQDPWVHDAIIELAKSGTVVLAAAGNDGPDADPTYPAAYPEAIAVTAVDRNLAPYAYANRGKYIAVAAPGVDVWTAMPGKQREGTQTGTSFAVPFATSVVALSHEASDLRHFGDSLAPRQRALEAMQRSIKPLGNRNAFGAGLIQAPSDCDPVAPGTVAGGWGSTTVNAVSNRK